MAAFKCQDNISKVGEKVFEYKLSIFIEFYSKSLLYIGSQFIGMRPVLEAVTVRGLILLTVPPTKLSIPFTE
jgi:hypothetical protein